MYYLCINKKEINNQLKIQSHDNRRIEITGNKQ